MQYTKAQRDAAGDALGYEVNDERIDTAFGSCGADEGLEELLDALEEFEGAGGRGIELADRIDNLRIVIAISMLNEFGEPNSGAQDE